MSERRDADRARLAAVIEETWLDARAALHALTRDVGFTTTVIVTLTIALAMNVAVFAVMDSVLARGFPLVEHDDRLLYIQERYPAGACCLTFADFAAWRAESSELAELAFVDGREITLTDSITGRNLDTSAAAITANTFGLLGVRPALGRDFVAADEEWGAVPAVMLSHRLWQARFGGRPDVVGRTVAVDGAPATVVGVMPPGFDFPTRHDLWLAIANGPELKRRVANGFMAVGRLAPGATQASVRAELAAINGRLAAEFPDSNRDVVPVVSTYAELFVGPDAPAVYASAWAAACFVLLMACANLANLTLARVFGRARELATRLALGASRWRLGRLLLMESVLLGAVSAVGAAFIARAAVAAWARMTDSQYQIIDYGVGPLAFGYLAGCTLATIVLFGALPAARVLRLQLDGLAGSQARGTRGRRDRRVVAALVTVQTTLAIVLLGGAGVLVRSLWNIVDADVGVHAPERVLTGWASLPRSSLRTPAEHAAFFEALREHITAVPGVATAAIANARPVDVTLPQRFEIEGRAVDANAVEAAPVVAAGPDYFGTVGAATFAGREFGAADGRSMPPTAIVNERFASEYFAGVDPVGRRLRVYDGDAPGEWRTIVGVVSNIMQSEPTRQRFAPLVYLPFAQAPQRGAWFFARAESSSDAIAAAVVDAAQALHADLTIEQVSTLEQSLRFVRDRMDLEHAELGKYAAIAPAFAVIALLLAGVGLYAVVAYAVGQRTKEIGVRMAVGATQHDIRRLVLRHELPPVAAGLVVGLGASLAATRVLESQLVGVSPQDPVTLTTAGALLVAVALLACQVPARRATRVDPVTALRND